MRFNKLLLILFILLFIISNRIYSKEQNYLNVSNLNILYKNIKILLNNSSLPLEKTSIKIISLKTNEIIFEHNPNKVLIPASNMKLITSAAALFFLGPNFTFSTDIYGDKPIHNGIIEGNIYIKGFGDPDLTTEKLWKISRELKLRGLNEVKGDVIGDISFFDDQQTGLGWKESYGFSSFCPRISALSLNQSTIKIWIRPNYKIGTPAIIELDPPTDFFELINQTTTSYTYSKLYITRSTISNGKNKILVKGNVKKENNSECEEINLDNPGLYTTSVFTELLKREGIKINGKTKLGQIKKPVILLVSSNSRPLTQIIMDLNKFSINSIAEQLLKFLGAKFRTPPGTSIKGTEVILNDFLKKEVGSDIQNIRIVDGSGLSPLNKISANCFIDVLKYMYSKFKFESDYLSSLAISGTDGTLYKRMKEAKGLIKAKTGFINGVSSLSGYTVTKDNEPIAFSIIINDLKNSAIAIDKQNKIGIMLNSFSRNN